MPVSRSWFIQKLVSLLLTSAFIFFVLLPALDKGISFFGVFLIVGIIAVLSWSIGEYLAGEHEYPVLIPGALAVVAGLVLFTFGGLH